MDRPHRDLELARQRLRAGAPARLQQHEQGGDGRLQPPVRGGWACERGEFFGDDEDDGRPVRMRFTRERLGPDRMRWSQDFAPMAAAGVPDGAWECNWVMDGRRLTT